MKVLTIRNPWAYAIFHLGKNVENRTWCPREYRGPLLIHAGANRPADPQEMLREYLKRPPSNEELKKNFVYSAIIGVVELKECISDSKSRWADTGEDVCHWILRRPRLFKHPVPCQGFLSLWNPPPTVLKKMPDWARAIDRKRSPK